MSKPEERVILIACQKPSLVFGGGHPIDTINKHLARSYQSNHFAPKHLYQGLLLIFSAASTFWYITTHRLGHFPRTLSKEWKAATLQYTKDQGSQIRFLDYWTPGQPIPMPRPPVYPED